MIEGAPAGAPSLSGAARTDRAWTYAELLAEAEHTARWLRSRFSPGERVTVWAPNIPEWIFLQYGCALAGLVLVTANPALRASELSYVIEKSRSVGIFFTDAFRGTDMRAMVNDVAAGIPAIRERVCFAEWERVVRASTSASDAPSAPVASVAPGDAAQIQYTSGTTGAPKGALLHHRGLVTNARFVAERMEFPRGGKWVTAMPLFHTAGCAMSVLGSASMRATLVLCQFFDPLLVLEQMARHQGDLLFGVPTMLVAIKSHPRFAELDTSSCRLIMSGGCTVPADLVRELEARFAAKFSVVYGQTEASPIITQTSPRDSADDKADTIGRPLWQVDVKVVHPTQGHVVPVGEQGEICARGYQVMLAYDGLPEASAAAIDGDGWLHTGDLGTMDARGFFTITGRLKDMIIGGGENIYPREVEDLLFSHPQILEAVVVGVPDAHWGEQVVAVLRLADKDNPPRAADLHAFCRAHLAPAQDAARLVRYRRLAAC